MTLEQEARTVLDALLSKYPHWDGFLDQSNSEDDKPTASYPRLLIPSEHPEIRTPLTIELGGYFSLYWYEGYFYDFIADDPCEDILEFLEGFFGETIRCGVCFKEGKLFGGGPVFEPGNPNWLGNYDRVEIKSWKGNRDAVYIKPTNRSEGIP